MKRSCRYCVSLRATAIGLLVIAQFLSAIGTTSFSQRISIQDTSRLYPCLERPCGCVSYEECWAGDCCCFTMAEKLAWAAKHNVTPPASAVRYQAYKELAQPKECPHCIKDKKQKSCCSESEVESESCCEQAPAKSVAVKVRWIVGYFSHKCKGQSIGGLGLLPVLLEPPLPYTVSGVYATSEWIDVLNHFPVARGTPPESPPPQSC